MANRPSGFGLTKEAQEKVCLCIFKNNKILWDAINAK